MAITGTSGNDNLVGTPGDDWIDGGPGGDRMAGGAGNDVYVVDSAYDKVIEEPGEGTDLVRSSVRYTLPSGVENLTLLGEEELKGTGNELHNRIKGNIASNRLFGLAGQDTVFGGGGDDILVGGMGNDYLDGGDGSDWAYYTGVNQLFVDLAAGFSQGFEGGSTGDTLVSIENVLGSSQNDVIYGNDVGNRLLGDDGDDYLWGRGGQDFLDGGAGSDTIEYRETAALKLTLSDSGGGTVYVGGAVKDTVRGIENVKSGDGADRIFGGAAANEIWGGGGDDLLRGYAGDDVIVTGAGNDHADGGDGSDWVSFVWGPSGNLHVTLGGANNWTNVVGAGGEVDKIVNFENVHGGGGNDTIIGNNAANMLYGYSGDDQLTGGGGADTFLFHLENGGVDTIVDFSSADDTIHADFLPSGPLGASAFVVGTEATTADHRIIYDQTSGAIYFDADGNGEAEMRLFAYVTPGTELTNLDFVGGSLPIP